MSNQKRMANVSKAKSLIAKDRSNEQVDTLMSAVAPRPAIEEVLVKIVAVPAIEATLTAKRKGRKETPAVEVKPEVKLCDIFAELTKHHTLDGFPLIRDVEKRLGSVWTDPKWGAEKNEGAAVFFARAIKTLTAPKSHQNIESMVRNVGADPFAANAPMPSNGISVTSVKAMPAKLTPVGAAIIPKMSKPRGEGWNGMSGSAIFRWAGSVGWSKTEAVKCLTALKLATLQEKSLPTLLKAGKDGFRVGSMTPEHAKELEVMAGRVKGEEPKKNAKK